MIDGEAATLGVSGRLWRDSLIMYDRTSRSLWSQVSGAGVAGPQTGQRLRELPSVLTTWGEWVKSHPDTLALVKPKLEGTRYDRYHSNPEMIGVRGTENPDDRLPGKTLVFAIERGDAFLAIPMKHLQARRVVQGEIGGEPIVVLSPEGGKATLAYRRQVGDQVLEFKAGRGSKMRLKDRQTGSTWSWQTGECLKGDCPVERLEPVEGTVVYWGIWAQFHPRTAVLRTDEGP